ncbi:MAG: penicillin-binding protein activator [Alphaproteobacteria bacterium]|jgi:ABC-type branched-subunit amino acid transport system substrate-binding protein|nr:penicillin-binding protein activator [Alphaproteobacteria bacterium]
MIKKLAIFLLLILLSACSFVFDSVKTTAPTTESTYNVAVVLPLSGKFKNVGESLLNTIHLAYSQNPNKNIVLKIYDSKSDNFNAAALVKQILADNNKAVIGSVFGAESLQIAKLLEEQNIPVFSLSNDISIINQASNLYTLSPLPITEMEASIDYASKFLGSRNFAVLVPDNKFGEIMMAGIKQSLQDRNLNLVRYVAYPTNNPRLTPFVQKLLLKKELTKINEISAKLASGDDVFDEKGNKITKIPDSNLDFDTLIIADFGNRVPVLASHFPSIGINTAAIKVIGLSNWNTPEIYTNNLLQGAVFADLNKFNNTDFARKYQEYYNIAPSLLDVAAFDSVITVMSLVYKDGDDLVNDFTSAKITSVNLQGLAGNFIITGDRTSRRNYSINQIDKNRGGVIMVKENLSMKDLIKNYNYGDLQIEKLS